MMRNVYLFVRKPSSLESIDLEALNDAGDMEYAHVAETQEMTTEEYDEFAGDFFKSRPWLAGKGGSKKYLRQVIAVSAPDRETLYIDPSGHDYARYVGLLVDQLEEEE
jgi:hypothetical protein